MPDRTIAEIAKEYDIPTGLEGMVKFIQDQMADMLAKSGMSAEAAKAKSEKLGAALVRPDLLPEGVAEKTFPTRAKYEEKRALGDLFRMQVDETGQKRVRVLSAEKTFASVNRAIEHGAFAEQVQKLVDEGKLTSKTISDASHANLVITAYATDFILQRYLMSRFLDFAQVVPMPQAMVRWPKLTSSTPTVVKHTRGASHEPEDIAIANVTLTANELFGSIIVPNETIRDANGPLMETIFREIGRQMKRQQLLQYATGAGTGSGEPLGIENGSYSKEVAVNGAVNWRHLIRALNTLGDEWTESPMEDGLVWVMNQSMKEVCQLIEDDVGRPMFFRLETTPMTTVGAVGPTVRPMDFTLAGIPGIVLPGLEGTATESDPSAIYLMAGKAAYYAGTREDLNIFPSEHVAAKQNSTYIRGTMGHDGQVAQSDAVCVLSGITG
jgi:HK97 family phage major capsid protein